jgi:Flp pilus assembly protein TadG
MRRPANSRRKQENSRVGGYLWSLAVRQDGSQLLEFALALPFLLVFAIGVMDFGQAYNLKQKLNNASREAARFAANENSGANNLSANGVSDTDAIADVVSNYLTKAGITQCTITEPPSVSASGFVFTFSASGTGCGSFALVIDREYLIAAGPPATLGKHVTLTYPYVWSFTRIMGLLHGSSFTPPSTIATDAVMPNIN